MIKIEPAALGLSGAVEPILRALPQWFGIEDATRMYIRAAGDHPTILAVDTERANLPIGFLTLLYHSAAAAEVYAMGVLPEYHRRGVGRALTDAAERRLRVAGVTFLQVETLSDKHPDPGYQKNPRLLSGQGLSLAGGAPRPVGAA